MKAIYKYLQTVGLVICTCLMLSACDDFLDTKPYDFVAPETFYTNESECKMARVHDDGADAVCVM